MLNFGQFREVPTVEKKSRPENSSSRILSPLSPRSHSLAPLARIPSDRTDSIHSILGRGPHIWFYRLWSWRRDSLASLATLRAMSRPFLFFLSQR